MFDYLPVFIYSSNRFADLDRNSEYQEIASIHGSAERNIPRPRIGSDERLRDLVVAENGGRGDMAFASNHKRVSDGDTYRRQFTTNDHAETKRGVRYAINKRQRAKLEADLFAAPSQEVDLGSTSWDMGNEGMSKGNDSSQIRDSELLLDDDQIREQFYADDTDDPLLAAILAPPPEFCSQSRDTVSGDVTGKTTEFSRRHVSVYAVHQKIFRRLNL